MLGTAVDVLTPTGAVVSATDDIDAAEARLVTLGVSELYVAGPEGQLLGVLPDYALLKRRVAGDLRAQTVAELMSPAVVRAMSATPLSELAVLMRASGVAKIPIVARERLIGEVTRGNLLRWLVGCGVLGAEASAASMTRGRMPGGPKFLRNAASDVSPRVLGGIANTS